MAFRPESSRAFFVRVCDMKTGRVKCMTRGRTRISLSAGSVFGRKESLTSRRLHRNVWHRKKEEKHLWLDERAFLFFFFLRSKGKFHTAAFSFFSFVRRSRHLSVDWLPSIKTWFGTGYREKKNVSCGFAFWKGNLFSSYFLISSACVRASCGRYLHILVSHLQHTIHTDLEKCRLVLTTASRSSKAQKHFL